MINISLAKHSLVFIISQASAMSLSAFLVSLSVLIKKIKEKMADRFFFSVCVCVEGDYLF